MLGMMYGTSKKPERRDLRTHEIIRDKNEQDVFLQSLITSMKVKTHRPRKEGAKGRVSHDFSFT